VEQEDIYRMSTCISIAQTNILCNTVSIQSTLQVYDRVLYPRDLDQSSHWQVALEVQEGMVVVAVVVDCPCIYYN
jgi:hypothetical protein